MARFLRRALLEVPLRLSSQRLLPFTMYLLSFLRGHRHAVWHWPDCSPSLGPRVVLFVHFDRRGAVQPYVLHYLKALKDSGFSVLLVSNSGKLQPEAVASLKIICDGILIRRNVGYDFSALKEGLRHFNITDITTQMLVMVNDSVYGPLSPIEKLFERVDFNVADIWGVTDSWQQRYHLQSFFIVVGQRALQHVSWGRFWAGVRPVANKTWIIKHYEVGFTQLMLQSGLRCAALWPYSALIRDSSDDLFIGKSLDHPSREINPVALVRAENAGLLGRSYAAREPLNPTAHLWKSLLKHGFPFIKRELLRDNPTMVADVVDWQEEIALIDPAQIEVIETDLKRTLRNKAP